MIGEKLKIAYDGVDRANKPQGSLRDSRALRANKLQGSLPRRLRRYRSCPREDRSRDFRSSSYKCRSRSRPPSRILGRV